MNLRRPTLLAGTVLAAMAFASASSAQDAVIHAGRLIDGVLAQPRAKVSILIHDGKVAAVEPGFVSPKGAEIVDLSEHPGGRHRRSCGHRHPG